MTDKSQIVVGGLISSSTSSYEVQGLLGSGTFGEVTQCRKLATNETVAIKMLKSQRSIEEAKREEEILKTLKESNADKFNIVRWNDSFVYEGRYCLEFEKLDISLLEFLQMKKTLQLSEIRPILQQLATALEFLKSIGMVHADLKPQNIMMVDHLHQPLKVKVIDFGLACDFPLAWMGATVQTRWYRSPEVILGAPFNEAIDVWSLGCIAVELMRGTVLFRGSDVYDMLRQIHSTIGQPPDHLLNAGQYSTKFFNVRCAEFTFAWTFKTTLEMGRYDYRPCTINSLSDLQKVPHNLSGEDAIADAWDRQVFVDLLTNMLKLDPLERITPTQILQHPFITMIHLDGLFDDSSYGRTAMELMSVCQDASSDDDKDVAQATCSTGEASNTTNNPAEHSAPDEGHPAGLSSEEQPVLQSKVISGENSPAKRKRDAADDSECGERSPNTNKAKKRRSECLDAALPESGGQASPQKSSLHKRKRAQSDSCVTSKGNSPAKRRRTVNLNKELGDAVEKLLSNTQDSSSSAQLDHHKKRKRTEEEASGPKQDQTYPAKRRRRRST